MEAVIAYDVGRLFIGPLSLTPRGIDRVDLAYAKHIFTTNPDAVGIIPTIWGIRCFRGNRVLPGLERLESLWSENCAPENDPLWSNLRARLQGSERDKHPARHRQTRLAQASRIFSLLKATGLTLGDSLTRGVPKGAVYINIGQITLGIPLLLNWLRYRPDVRPVFMLHDVIPLETPELVEPADVRAHSRMVDMVIRHAKGLIVTTQAARMAVEAEMARRGRISMPIFARSLPVSAHFHGGVAPDAELLQFAYFVVCGSLEPRKNHDLLSQVWQRLCEELGEGAPHLVVVGARGWQGDAIEARLKRSQRTRGRLHVVSGLSSPALARLMAGARALLMPSHIEGFGLPIAEAQAMGLQVIASDIPAHREIRAEGTILIDPLDGKEWLIKIAALSSNSKPTRHESENTTIVTGWSSYFDKLGEFLHQGEK